MDTTCGYWTFETLFRENCYRNCCNKNNTQKYYMNAEALSVSVNEKRNAFFRDTVPCHGCP